MVAIGRRGTVLGIVALVSLVAVDIWRGSIGRRVADRRQLRQRLVIKILQAVARLLAEAVELAGRPGKEAASGWLVVALIVIAAILVLIGLVLIGLILIALGLIALGLIALILMALALIARVLISVVAVAWILRLMRRVIIRRRRRVRWSGRERRRIARLGVGLRRGIAVLGRP